MIGVRLRSLAFLLLAACSLHRPVPHDSPDAAASYFAAKRGNVDVVARWAEARSEMRRVRQAPSPVADGQAGAPDLHRHWKFLGPGNIGGRTRPLIIDPNEPDTIYAGAVSGGVFKTIDGGAHWSATGDALANLAVNSLAMSPTDSRTIFAGTGEGYFREDVRGTALPIRGDGIFVTRDGAASWTQLASTKNDEDFYWVNDLAISTHDPHRIYAATRTGVWRSTDEGESWTRVLATSVKGGCLELAFRADTNGDYLFASCGMFEQATVYRAKNAESDQQWTAVLSEPGMSRTSLAIAPSNPSIVYALAAKNVAGALDQTLLGVYRSSANGDPGTWIAQQTPTGALPGALLLSNPYSATLKDCTDGELTGSVVPMGWHCNTITVDPLDPDRVWAAGVDVFRSDDGARTWGLASYWWADTSRPSYSHADHHGIVFHPRYDGDANQTLIVTNDGGTYRTDNARAAVARGTFATCDDENTSVHWRTLNHSYGATQFYHGAVMPDGRSYLGGAQDNGTLRGRFDDGPDAWQEIFGGDGGYVAINPQNTGQLFFEYQWGRIYRLDGNHLTNAMPVPIDDFLFVTPIIYDPNDSTRVWTGGRRALRSNANNIAWTRASAPMNSQVTSLAVQPGNSNVVIAGTTSGRIYRTQTATSDVDSAWSFTTPRDGWVASVSFDGSAIFATYAKFGGAHIWKSIDGARNWFTIDGDLPDLPVHTLAVDPIDHRLYIATDLGVWSSTDNGAHWLPDEGLPQVITEWITIARGAHGPALYAFTHGRGVWRLELTDEPRRRAFGR